jgi:hypothetical protein
MDNQKDVLKLRFRQESISSAHHHVRQKYLTLQPRLTLRTPLPRSQTLLHDYPQPLSIIYLYTINPAFLDLLPQNSFHHGRQIRAQSSRQAQPSKGRPYLQGVPLSMHRCALKHD